jgi:threonine synthase
VPGVTAAPTPLNAVTFTRYHVDYIRADGRNTPGVDVPFPFDAAQTFTVQEDFDVVVELVRHVAKAEAPLRALVSDVNIISTIATITFYGKDQAGNAVSVTGQVQVNFGNFADPT